jgi:hypothetical protein
MKTQLYQVNELNLNEIKEISGGSELTQCVFQFFGRLFGYVNQMMEAEAKHGATGAW